jgi:hypothetical protein
MRRTVEETAISAVGCGLFLLVAYLLATRGFLIAPGDSSGSEVGVRVIGPLIFGFFGLLMAVGAIVGGRRLLLRRVLEVGPDGLWSPAAGRLAWSDVAEIRHETYARPAGRHGGSALIHRLGIVPVDPARIHLPPAERAVQLLSRGYRATLGRAGRRWTGAGGLTTYGISSAELEVSFDEVLARVGEFFPISEPTSPR